MKELVNRQRDDVIRALSGHGQYQLCEPYKHLQVDPQDWVKMTPDQRKLLLKRFASLHKSYDSQMQAKSGNENMMSSTETELPCTSNTSSYKTKDSEISASKSSSEKDISLIQTISHTAPSVISIAYNECGIISLPLATVESMWSKAEEYLKSDCDIVPAPDSDHKAKMVSSHSSNTPHFVCALHLGQYVCDSNCLQWKSAQICSHIIAVAEKNGELHSF